MAFPDRTLVFCNAGLFNFNLYELVKVPPGRYRKGNMAISATWPHDLDAADRLDGDYGALTTTITFRSPISATADVESAV